MSEQTNSKTGGLTGFFRGVAKSFTGNNSKVVYEGDSAYHHITIIDAAGVRTLYMGNQAQESETSISLANPETPVFEYPGLFFLGLALTPKNKNILMLGLGGGFIPNLFKKYLKNHQLTVIEVDPLIAELASIYFGFEPGENVKLVINDGFEFIAKAQNGSYDQIWLDAFNGDYIPDHMRSPDFLAMIKLKLVNEGLAVQNLHQTAWLQYRFQLEDTVRVFNKAPRLFAGARSGNTVSMSLNSDTVELPTTTVGLLAKIKAFQPKVGPYDLTEEAKKLIFKKGLESQLT